jgi:hypothetical protein
MILMSGRADLSEKERLALLVIERDKKGNVKGTDLEGFRTRKFIEALDIRPGDVFYDAKVIYWAYMRWCKETKTRQVDYYLAFSKWNTIFTRAQKRAGKYTNLQGYLLQPNINFNYSQDEMEIICQYFKEDRQKRLSRNKRRTVKVNQRQEKRNSKKLTEEILLQVLMDENSPK